MYDDDEMQSDQVEDLSAETAVSRRRRDRGILVSILLSALLIFVAWWVLTHLRGAQAPDQKDQPVATSVKKVKIPNVVGLSRSKAVRVLRGAGLVPATEVSYDGGVAPGKASYQSPPAGKKVVLGTLVNVGIASEFAVGGEAPVPESDYTSRVPDVVGMKRSHAVAAMEDAGYGSSVQEIYSLTEPSGVIFSQTPSGGNSAAPGTLVTLLLSLGKPPAGSAEVPTVLGMSSAQARRAVEAQGLEYREMFQPMPSGIGEIYDQSPKSGIMLDKGDTVFVLIAVGQ